MKIQLYRVLIPALLIGLTACNSTPEQVVEETAVPMTISQIADSVRYFRDHFLQTDLVSREKPELSREDAIAIQLSMLEQELAAGARLVGWKMGGTAVKDSASFDPVFGYILDRYMVPTDSLLNSANFPGGSMLVEGEIGFIIKSDLPDGVASKEALLEQIESVVAASELAQSTAIPSGEGPLPLNYVLATGMGQVGTIEGSKKVPPQDFDFENETVRCFLSDTLAAEGVASNIFGNPLNAVYELANQLPAHDHYLKAGDIVITGSVYQNPSIQGAADIRIEFSSLGTISFKSK